MRTLPISIIGLVIAVTSATADAAPTVYTGYDFAFTKVGGADESDPANQDMITPNVKITRGGQSGIYNAAVETFYSSLSSPMGTEWAFPYNNPEAMISASVWDTLNFDDWETAFGLGIPSGGEGPPSTVDQNAVVHLIDDDIYLDIRFTEWGIGPQSGGSFAYVRSVVGSSPSADFNDDGIVDGEDFLIWQRNFGSGTMFDQGDADGDSDVDADDLDVWQLSYGGNLLANSTAVPEPSALVLALLALASKPVRRPR